MVRGPVCAEPWQPVSYIRQRMLANSFSFLPVRRAAEWCLISDLEIATYLGANGKERNQRLAHRLDAAGIPLQLAKRCVVDTPLEIALRIMGGDQRPLLVCATEDDPQVLVGIVTPFDLL